MTVLGLLDCADGSGTDVGCDVFLDLGPPELSLYKLERAALTWVSRQVLVMPPPQNLRMKRLGDIGSVRRCVPWGWLGQEGLLDLGHKSPPNLTHNAVSL